MDGHVSLTKSNLLRAVIMLYAFASLLCEMSSTEQGRSQTLKTAL